MLWIFLDHMGHRLHQEKPTMSTLGNPAPLGLLCFGMTTMALMFVEMGWCEKGFEVWVAALALSLGGFGQVLVGIFEILKGSSFSFAVFECYGFFWITWAIVFIERSNLNSTFSDAKYTMGYSLYLGQWGVLTACFWILTWRKNIALISIFFLLTLTFFILAFGVGLKSENVLKTGGYFGFATAVGAFYTGVAELINEEYGRHILPGLRPIHSPQRVILTKESVQSLINYDERSNTLWLQFRGLQVRSLDDVNSIREGVVAAIEHAINTPHAKANHLAKVHVVADYEQTFIGDEVAVEYWKMAASLEKQYYLSATRFHVSSFGTTTSSPAVLRGAVLHDATTTPANLSLRGHTEPAHVAEEEAPRTYEKEVVVSA